MIRPQFEPQADNTFKIVHPPVYAAVGALLRKIEAGEMAPADAIARLKEVVQKYPWNFHAAYLLSGIYGQAGEFQKACDTRFKACQRLMELLPDDEDAEPVALDFERKENQHPLFLLHGSAIDHFLISEFDLAAALIETLLDLDEEDHLDVSQTLAYCYVALNEQDSFEAVLPDLDEKGAEKRIVALWAQHRFAGRIDPVAAAEFKKKFPVVYSEFTAEEHPVTEGYLADIDSDRPSQESRARKQWLKTEHLWQQFPEFLVQLKNS